MTRKSLFLRKPAVAGSRRPRPARLSFEPLEPRQVLDSTVVFNEIMYNPPGAMDDTLEWIELYNQLAVNMDISDWSIEGGIEYTFPDGTAVAGRGVVVVAKSPSDLEAATGYADALGPFTGQLSNGGEELRLVNNDGRLMNVVDYGDGGDWPVGPDGGGVSLVKRDLRAASEPAESWTFSDVMGGTPGVVSLDPPDAQTLVPAGATWKYLDNGSNQGTAWYGVGFNDGSWVSGRAQLGYGDGDEATVVSYGPSSTNKYITTYFRHTCTVAHPGKFDELTLEVLRDDGAVVYLNGQEAVRSNMPSGAINYQTRSASTVGGGEEDTFYAYAIDPGMLIEGGNLLAVEIHQTSSTSSDISFDLRLTGRSSLPVDYGLGLIINEVAPATEEDFWLEIVNLGAEDIDLEGFVLTATGAAGGEHVFPAQTIAAGEFLAVYESELGFQGGDEEKLFLYTPGEEQLVDARVVKNRLRGRSEEHEGRWLYPDEPTPGDANSFDFHEEIVINEIMYHAPPKLATETEPFEESTEEWIELYNRGTATVDLTGWKLQQAIEYEFADGTTIGPRDYLVVAKDAAALAAKYPTINIVGDFSRWLSDRDERILLVDANDNTADEVHYYERGQWPEYADGGGSSLELGNPFADNSKGEAWAASDERTKSTWSTYTIRKTCNEPLEVSTVYNEFIFGLLDSGEFLIDDISVKRGGTTQMIQNGTFEADTLGTAPDKWRLIGTHSGTVVVDPHDADKKVLHVVVRGPQQYVHDHAETTFVNNTAISDGTQYEISFRAKWLAGNSQLNNRFYFTRMSNTVYLAVPEKTGTPGAQNSTYEANIGPTYSGFGHAPVLPSSSQNVTVSVEADDPHGVSSVTLRWNVNGGTWNSVAMTAGTGGVYRGTIPGKSSGTVVQFYVEGEDGLGVKSTFPAAGPDSRALYQVDDGKRPSKPIDSVRLVLLSADNNTLFSSVNKMSNNYVGTSVIYNGEEAFYDVELRQIGSRFIRPNSGYKVRLNPAQKLYGVHDSFRIDRSGGGPREIYMKQMVNRAGGSSVSLYDDIAYVISPRYTGTILFQLARYEDVFLDEQFENGAEGTKFELDDITFPTNPEPYPEGLKTGTGYSAQDMKDRGPDKEAYRGHLLIKNNRAKDEYGPIVAMCDDAIHYSGTTLYNKTREVMDVDLWMRHYATQSYLGNWDTYGFRRPKNLRMYIRPEDGKVIPMYWDADLANLTENLLYHGGASRLDEIRDRPQNLRLFWGHMQDLMNRSFNRQYIEPWINHYSSLGAGIGSDVPGKVEARVNEATTYINNNFPFVPFRITTNNGNDFSAQESHVTIQGDGWINVRQIRLAGSTEPLEVTWIDFDSWQVTVPLEEGPNELNFEALDYQGDPAGSDTITVTATLPFRPFHEFLRVTELHYNPADPSPDELAQDFLYNDDFEFIELQNIGDQTLDLTGVSLTEAVQFDFSGMQLETGVLITEAGTDSPDYVEVQNVSAAAVDTSGWVVAVNDASGEVADINNVEPMLWHLPDSMPRDQVLYQSDDDGDAEHYWGDDIFWRTKGPGWTMLVDDHGNVADFVVWGYGRAEIDSLSVNVNGHDVTVGDVWNGDAVPANMDSANTLQRIGSSDHDAAMDWTFTTPHSRGSQNANLYTPFFEGGTELGPGEMVIVARNTDAFEYRYGTQATVVGHYDGKLNDGGDWIRLIDPAGNDILSFEYENSEDGWPGRADGKGASLELIDPTALPQSGAQRTEYLQNRDNWRSSSEYGGSPGKVGEGPRGDIVVNEVLTNTPDPMLDAIELHNTTDQQITIGRWYLSDSWGWESSSQNGNYKKFRIPPGTEIPAYGYVVFDEDDFNPSRGQDENDFALNGARGDDVWLMEADAEGTLTRFVDHVDFMAAKERESLGPWPDAEGEFCPMAETTLGSANSGPRVGPVVISEVHYNPGEMEGADDLEYLEIYNSTGQTVDLTNWLVREGIEFDFPVDTVLPPFSPLVVLPFDPANPANASKWSTFCAQYGVDENQTASFVGGYSRTLNDDGERVQLLHPDDPVWDPDSQTYFTPHFLEDEVIYDDEGDWPADADGQGDSLHRLGTDLWGNEAAHWTSADPTPAGVIFLPERTVKARYIFYNNSAFDGNDPTANEQDKDAIATDKEALRPNETAGFDNYTSYSRGINGIIVDIANPLVTPTADDFSFRVGNSDDPDSWAAGPNPTSVTVTPEDGLQDSDRVTIIFEDYEIRNKWLEVTVHAGALGLTGDDVFYFGNAVGESGNSDVDALVDQTDVALTRNNPRGFFNSAPLTFAYDFNRDARVGATDVIIARSNLTTEETALKLIHLSGPEGSGGSEKSLVATSLGNGASALPEENADDGTSSITDRALLVDSVLSVQPAPFRKPQPAAVDAPGRLSQANRAILDQISGFDSAEVRPPAARQTKGVRAVDLILMLEGGWMGP